MGEVGLAGSAPGQVVGDAALLHHQDAVAGGEELGEVVGDDEDPEAVGGEVADDAVDLGLRADVDADGRAVQHQHARGAGQPAGEDHALLIAAGGQALAASATNLDDETRTLLVTEGGNQSELALAAGETVEFCPSGCFVTMPNGDREALTGSEAIEISNGQARVK